MKTKLRNISLVAMLVAVVFGSLLFTGCASPVATAGKVLVTTVQSVDVAMRGWWAYEALGKASEDQIQRVKALYLQYQIAESIAEKAYFTAKTTGNLDGWNQAAASLRAVQSQLLSFIATTQPKATP